MNIANHSLDDLKNLFFFGEKVETPYFTFYPPTIKDVLDSGQSEFTKYVTTLIGKKDKPSFSLLLENTQRNDTLYAEVTKSLEFFLKEKPFYLPDVSLIVLGNPKDNRVINENLFSVLQEYLNIYLHLPPKTETPKDEKPHEKKMREAREKVEEAKRKKAEKDDDSVSYSLLDMISSVSLEMSMPPKSLYECSYYFLTEQFERIRRKFNSELSYQQLLVGADPKKLDLTNWFYSRAKK